ncbi:MAG: hypothetical protein QOI60_475 [Actinomycetota bacterium]|nr:hypothetical protein [Actinomycetota bacterium]
MKIGHPGGKVEPGQLSPHVRSIACLFGKFTFRSLQRGLAFDELPRGEFPRPRAAQRMPMLSDKQHPVVFDRSDPHAGRREMYDAVNPRVPSGRTTWSCQTVIHSFS